MGEFTKQLGWLVQSCTTDVLKQLAGPSKKKQKDSGGARYNVKVYYSFPKYHKTYKEFGDKHWNHYGDKHYHHHKHTHKKK